ncbi:MAG: citramalate synthase [Planctomycetes bacterium]|nr:citramalate synthase [Planctomycetota bacterium]
MSDVKIYDTTLRDGTQMEGVSLSLTDKLAITEKLDWLGVDYIEGGFPISNPKDEEYFRRVKDMNLKHARIVAFGMTRRAKNRAEDDSTLSAMVASGAKAVAVVGKSWDFHVTDVLRVSLDENLSMIADSVRFLKEAGLEVIFDAEHFFDGYEADADYALATLAAAVEGGADWIVPCDTNGGGLPARIAEIMQEVTSRFPTPAGIHCHNDGNVAVASSLAAVEAGATMVQGTINGMGERCGNADLTAVLPNLVLKMGRDVLPREDLRKITEVSRFVWEMANFIMPANQPFVGPSAFAHKGGMHGHAVAKDTRTYEHIEPESVGNERHIVISELSGTANVQKKLQQLGLAVDKDLTGKILKQVASLENEGYQFEAADGSFALLVKKLAGTYEKFFEMEGFRVTVTRDREGLPVTEATVKISVGDQKRHTAAEGDGPVNAFDGALRKALEDIYPALKGMHLVDYKVRVVNPRAGTAAKVRVVIESQDRCDRWGTVGVSENIIEASYQALADSIEYKLMKEEAC